VAFRFTARLRGSEPHGAGYIEVPSFVMRGLKWGRYVRVVATINEKHELPATVINVGWGPSFLVSHRDREHAGVELNAPVSITLRRLHHED
jgi:hypothetical protein